eukprot:126631-Prymnesium_polylepis.1
MAALAVLQLLRAHPQPAARVAAAAGPRVLGELPLRVAHKALVAGRRERDEAHALVERGNHGGGRARHDAAHRLPHVEVAAPPRHRVVREDLAAYSVDPKQPAVTDVPRRALAELRAPLEPRRRGRDLHLGDRPSVAPQQHARRAQQHARRAQQRRRRSAHAVQKATDGIRRARLVGARRGRLTRQPQAPRRTDRLLARPQHDGRRRRDGRRRLA